MIRIVSFASVCIFVLLTSCATTERPTANYLNFKTPTPVQAAGIQMIELAEGYKVWTKRFGNSPMKVLLLHGGPAATHEYLECFESFFPQANIEDFVPAVAQGTWKP